MADPVWGNLAKAQDDPETIEEAITRLIVAHEADADAHTGSGESLETHKAQAVVDHPRGSVVADKDSYTESIYRCTFESLDAWDTLGTVQADDWPGARLYIETGAVEHSELTALLNHSGNWINYNFDMLMKFTMWSDLLDNYKIWAQISSSGNSATPDGFGYYIVDNVVKGFWGNAGGTTFTADLNIDITDGHVFVAQYDSVDVEVRFYINGALVATITDIGSLTAFEPDIYFRAETNGECDGWTYINQFMISRGE